MIVVDSSAWIGLLRVGRTVSPTVARLAIELESGGPLAITDVVYMELLRGRQTAAQLAAMRMTLAQTEVLRMKTLADYEFAADLFRDAQAKGHTVRQATDCMIAAVCIREQLPLLHDDADFDRIADVSKLQVVAT